MPDRRLQTKFDLLPGSQWQLNNYENGQARPRQNMWQLASNSIAVVIGATKLTWSQYFWWSSKLLDNCYQVLKQANDIPGFCVPELMTISIAFELLTAICRQNWNVVHRSSLKIQRPGNAQLARFGVNGKVGMLLATECSAHWSWLASSWKGILLTASTIWKMKRVGDGTRVVREGN